MTDQLGLRPLGPDGELLDGRGAERVRGHEQDVASLRRMQCCELADGRRLADPVDAEHEDDPRPLVEHYVCVRREHLLDLFPEHAPDLIRAGVAAHPRAHARDDLRRRARADIRGNESFLELGERPVEIRDGTSERRVHPGCQAVPGRAERAPEPLDGRWTWR